MRRAGWFVLGMVFAGGSAFAADAVATGEYNARLADCGACHTKVGGTPFAGGLGIDTPFGTLTSTNITPDKDTGIGGWSDDTFVRAVTDGIGHDGKYLYPAMPFPSYTKMTRDDVLSIKAYLFSLAPVHAPSVPSGLAFPFNIRMSMIGWRLLFFSPGVYRPDPARSAEWNRGAYIVEGPGHCGACHSPRNIFGSTDASQSLGGGSVGRWLAPNISADPRWGIGDWTAGRIAMFLKTGVEKTKGVAFGPMAEVVHDSLRYISDDDLRAVAVFLKSAPERTQGATGAVATAAALAQGQTLYMANCAKCHQKDGTGFAGAVANLSANGSVTSATPDDIIDAVLSGLHGTGTYGTMPSFAGKLTDQDISDIANYVRTGWGNNTPANATPALVANLRVQAAASLKQSP